MRIAITGATGNVGTSLLRALAADESVEEIIGIARRMPDLEAPRTRFVQADVTRDDLVPHLGGVDAVIHLAWLIQPSRDREQTRTVNVDGSRRVFEAARRAGVPALVHASSVGAYSPGPKDRAVDESWPTDGIRSSFYSRDKADVETILDDFTGDMRVVRLRPGLIFKASAASGIRKLFAGPLLPTPLLHPGRIAFVPDVERLRIQAVHSHDIAEAFRLAATRDVEGAFNVAAEPVLDPAELSRVLDARRVRIPARVLRAFTTATFALHLQPTPPGWLDLALGVPIMDTTRARDELGWTARHSSGEALRELLHGLHRRDELATKPLVDEPVYRPAGRGSDST